jgi:hypothetical protein
VSGTPVKLDHYAESLVEDVLVLASATPPHWMLPRANWEAMRPLDTVHVPEFEQGVRTLARHIERHGQVGAPAHPGP